MKIILEWDELIQLAYKEALRVGTLHRIDRDKYEWFYVPHFKDEEKRTGLYVEFTVREKTPPPDPEDYQNGSWKEELTDEN